MGYEIIIQNIVIKKTVKLSPASLSGFFLSVIQVLSLFLSRAVEYKEKNHLKLFKNNRHMNAVIEM